MNQKLIRLMRNYRHYHTKSWTVYSHFVGIPLVTFSIMLCFSWFQLTLTNIIGINFMWIGIIALAIFYIRLDRAMGSTAAMMLILLGWLANYVAPVGFTGESFIIFLAAFIVGWIFQLAGHVVEGRKPALVDNFLESVFIAPLFIVAEIFFRLGWKKDLQAAIEAESHPSFGLYKNDTRSVESVVSELRKERNHDV